MALGSGIDLSAESLLGPVESRSNFRSGRVSFCQPITVSRSPNFRGGVREQRLIGIELAPASFQRSNRCPSPLLRFKGDSCGHSLVNTPRACDSTHGRFNAWPIHKGQKNIRDTGLSPS